MFTNTFPNAYQTSVYGCAYNTIPAPSPKKVDDKKIPNVLQFKADYSGCSFYRMQMAETIMNYSGIANVLSLNKTTLDEKFLSCFDVIRLQRFTTPLHLKYIEYLKGLQSKYGFRLIFEIDDNPFIEYIPQYNIARKHYISDDIQNSIKQSMLLCDEITVTVPYMKKLFAKKLGVNNITVLPNYQARWWMNNNLLYNQLKINRDYDNNKNKPRILYCGSNAHYNSTSADIPDDTWHVIDAIINNVNNYQWVFLGGYPKQLKPWVNAGKIEYHKWTNLTDYPTTLYNLNIQAAIAPLVDNDFNKCKSNIKFTEMLHYGIPVFCQDIETYKDAFYKFTTGEQLINLLNEHVKRAGHYKNLGIKHFNESKKWVLDNPENIGLYSELYKYPFGSPERKLLAKFNNEN